MQAVQESPQQGTEHHQDQYRTLIELFLYRSSQKPDQPALHVKRDGSFQPICWKELATAVEETALGLADLGIETGDRVAILSENRPEWPIADLGSYGVGATVVPIYATNSAPQVEYILQDSGSRVVFCSTTSQAEKVVSFRSKLDTPCTIVTFDEEGTGESEDSTILTMNALRNRGRNLGTSQPELYLQRARAVGPEDLASIIYTSGTTGLPKGVMLTHSNFVSNVKAAGEVLPMQPDDLALSFLPLSHVFERTCGLYIMLLGQGSQIAYAESIETVPQDMLEVRPTLMASVPRLYEKIYDRIHESVRSANPLRKFLFRRAIAVGESVSRLQQAGQPIPFFLSIRRAIAHRLVLSKIHARTGGRLRYFISGGAPLSQEIAEFFHAAGMLILEGYGLTETAPALTMNTPEAYRFGTVGKTIPGVEIRIAEDGEIITRGPNIMRGYFGLEEETREAIDPEGWFHTGDVGEFDADGFLRITDRKKDLIVTSGGKNVAPQLIENQLKTNPLISQLVCVGDKRKFVSALIVPAFDILEKVASEMGIPTVDREALLRDPRVLALYESDIETAQDGLARYEKIKTFRLLPQEFSQETGELTPTHKVKRRVVQEKYEKLIDEMYSG